MPFQHLHCFWHLFINALFLDVWPKTHLQLLIRLLFHQFCQFCCLPKWRGIFQALLEHLDSRITVSKTQYYQKTALYNIVLFYSWYHKLRRNNQHLDRKRLLSFWIFTDLQCPRSAIKNMFTSKLMTLPSTKTSFSMKSAPTVAL